MSGFGASPVFGGLSSGLFGRSVSFGAGRVGALFFFRRDFCVVLFDWNSDQALFGWGWHLNMQRIKSAPGIHTAAVVRPSKQNASCGHGCDSSGAVA